LRDATAAMRRDRKDSELADSFLDDAEGGEAWAANHINCGNINRQDNYVRASTGNRRRAACQ
jgi:hypothetical protein